MMDTVRANGRGEVSVKKAFTIGHSTLDLSAFLNALAENAVQHLVDVRAFPGSRRYPWFGRDSLEQSVPASGVVYQWMPALGGRRKATANTVNAGWRNESFRGYADYMQTSEFGRGLTELIEISQRQQVAYMCSEAVPWRCHRSLISDALTARGFPVEHIFVKPNGQSERKPHSMTPFARIEGGPADPQITYPLDKPEEPEQPEIPFGAKTP